jgi:hypothetical protein
MARIGQFWTQAFGVPLRDTGISCNRPQILVRLMAYFEGKSHAPKHNNHNFDQLGSLC